MRLQFKRLFVSICVCIFISVQGVHVLAASPYENEKIVRQFQASPGVKYEDRRYQTADYHTATRILSVNTLDQATSIQLYTSSPITLKRWTTAQAQANSRLNEVVVGAVNANFFELQTGIPAYFMMRNGQILSDGSLVDTLSHQMNAPYAFGITASGQGKIDKYELDMSLRFNNDRLRVKNVNADRTINSIVVFTPSYYYSSTKQNEYGQEIVVRNVQPSAERVMIDGVYSGTVAEIREYGKGDTTIPKDGFVISANGDSVKDLSSLQVGDPITFHVTIDEQWKGAQLMLASGPLLVDNGQVSISMNENASFAKSRHPRTAVGIDRRGENIFFVTIDGRKTGYSEGATIREAAEYMQKLGAYKAINLDGGASTEMAVRFPGQMLATRANQPADGGRPVSATLQFIDSRKTPDVVLLNAMNQLNDWKATTAGGAEATLELSQGNEPSREGQAALKLAYDFTTGGSVTKAAYLTPNEPILLLDRPKQIGMWVYGNQNQHWLRATLTDGSGQAHRLNFTNEAGFDWAGWRYVTADIPANIALPMSIRELYVAEANVSRQTSNTFYVTKLQVHYTSTHTEQRFTDIPPSFPSFEQIMYLTDRGLINGYADGTFQPGQSLTRAHAAIILAKELKLDIEQAASSAQRFTDVPTTHPQFGAIAAVQAAGIFKGKEDGRFDPNGKLTRAQMAVILYNAFSLSGHQGKQTFVDVPPSHPKYDAIESLAYHKISTGFSEDRTFRPNNDVTRSQFAVFMSATLQR